MGLELRIAGPGIDVARRLEPGDAALILGRDAECGVCLPDPDRNVSRRHLSVWNEADQLHFHVLSVVNGIEMPFGEAPPGARGILPHGQTLKIAEYMLTVDYIESAVPPPADDDPWAALDRNTAQFDATQPGMPAARPEADPFGDWGFGDTFGVAPPGGGPPLQANSLTVAQDIGAFYKGLGIDAKKVGVLSEGELESIGRIVRMAMLGMIELHRSVAGAKLELRTEDRTQLAPKGDRNPLKEAGLPDDVALHYLFGGRMAAVGYVGPEKGLRDLVAELVLHEKANTAAARAAVEGVLKEFDPEVLKDRLLGGGARLFESARAWDAYAKDYALHKDDLARWAQRLLDKHFAGAYQREVNRVKRDTGPGKG